MFFAGSQGFLKQFTSEMTTLNQSVQQALQGLGLELVELERSPGGLLRVTIDWPWQQEGSEERAIGLEDCERASRQLQYLLEVDGVDYRRLEVSSPGIDRKLRGPLDLQRFEGHWVELKLKQPIGAAAAGQVAANRKKFRGRLQRNEDGEGWQITWSAQPAPTRTDKLKRGKNQAAEPDRVMSFEWSELESARLSPELDFKGKNR